MAASSSTVKFLASVPMFAELDAAQLGTLHSFCSLKVLAKGETAAVEGVSVDELGIVVSGRLRDLSGGTSVPELGQGAAVETRAFFTQRLAASTYAAVRETVLLTLAWDDLLAAFRTDPDLLASFCSGPAFEEYFAPAPSRPARLVICPAGANGQLDPGMTDALIAGFESVAEVRLLRRGSFGGGKPGAITLGVPETAHWLQEQELEFDLTVTLADASDPDFTQEAIEEADEIVFIASGQDAALSDDERHALHARGADQCRLAIPAGHGIAASTAANWAAPRRYRTAQAIDFASPGATRRMASAILGKGIAVAATSRGVYAAAILGALQALEANEQDAVCLTAAGSAVLPAGLLASGVPVSKIDEIFCQLANPAIWKRASRADAGLFEAAPVDKLFKAALSGHDIALFERPFFALSLSLSTGAFAAHREGSLESAVRPGLLPPGFLPPAVLKDGTILVSGENETDALLSAAKTLSASSIIFLYPDAPPLGGSTTSYRRLIGASSFLLTPFQAHAPTDKRVRLETVLGATGRPLRENRADATFAVPIQPGVTPMDWAEWATLRDAAFEWMSAQIETQAHGGDVSANPIDSVGQSG